MKKEHGFTNKKGRDENLDTEDIRNQMYEIMSLLIDRLQMVRLWGYGFPDLPLFVFVLRKYLEYS